MDSVESRAREIWYEREKSFPRFVQQTWEQGTELARAATMARAHTEIERIRKERANG